MNYFIQQLINGLALGSIYGLIAIGYTMVYGIMRMINFANGDIFMLGGFSGFIIFSVLTTSFPELSIIVVLAIMLMGAVFVCSLWNWSVERIAYRPLRKSFRLAPLVTSIGVSISITNFVQASQGSYNKAIPPLMNEIYKLGKLDISLKQIVVISVTLVLLSIFWFVVNKTAFGRAQRASEQDATMTALLGINVDKIISITFVVAASLAAIAGIMYLIYYGVISFYSGYLPGIKAFTAAVLGGIGSMSGAVLGGVLVGLIESFWSAYLPVGYKDIATFSILILVLLFKPTGILGRPEVEKV
ncbi:High-affinity branched-chain amino acid transport system permease protein LivH [Liberibacter crescens BT-1]|uniref:High-affinity branched-chain amino acid transport system permease protein LivH n=1 Tax=Liberibacter crescens (strain BT-1) TaxID=1215343 RepID=L0EXD3_LIBCB|nr:branched-chain amino acid ABC transporter permease [Liberibacter crescens]AGA65021.1 High-affinity branched-chain amino acid transport system permease protein LivH [Liberibacter crescens BT-1]AMC13027.1 branched-chain amino acid transporter permease subunit LivH [Liberibacter crescens]